jgi:hypothetical protein
MQSPTFCKLLLAAWLAFFSLALDAQGSFEMMRDANKVDIPFVLENNLVVVNVVFNRIFPLKFIFDTGAEHTILSERNLTDLLRVPYEREFKLLGADMKTTLKAYLVRGIHLKIENLVLPYHSLLVLDQDYLRFRESLGVEIHGILGADAFRGLVVKINYERRVITLYKTTSFPKPGKQFKAIPIEVHRNKPYLAANIVIQQDTTIPVKLLLDTGASLSALLYTDTHEALAPPSNTIYGNLGVGLGGFLEGYLGRVRTLRIGDLELNEVLTNFQQLPQTVDSSILFQRNGLLGNQVLSRFTLIIDYPREAIYLQPNSRFKSAFEFDKSGLVVIASGASLQSFVVHDVLPGSPARAAGLLPGDVIKRVNAVGGVFLTLRNIQKTLRKKEGKKINMVVKRGKKRLKFEFRLRKLV